MAGFGTKRTSGDLRLESGMRTKGPSPRRACLARRSPQPRRTRPGPGRSRQSAEISGRRHPDRVATGPVFDPNRT
jgi:hypothetical protein